MKTKFIENKINYDGAQLKPLYAYTYHGLSGDCVLAFEGACNVSLEHMVDMEDLIVKAEIKADHMLHFIVEIFRTDLVAAVALQRLLVSIAQNILLRSNHILIRKGDDLYFDQTLDVITATLGGKISIKGFDKTVAMDIPAGTDGNKVFRLKGMGMPLFEDPSKRGDAYVRMLLRVPKNLSAEEKKLLEKFAELRKDII